MAFNIAEFSSQIDRWGIQKPSHYEVIITTPLSISSPITNEIPFRANSVNLPGFNIGTDDIKHKGYGLSEKRANSIGFEDITITFVADGHGHLEKMFNDWLELVFPTNDGTHGIDNVEFFEYPENYYGGLDISIFDQAGNKDSTWTIVDPYPTVVGAVQMSWETTDSILILPVTFSYRNYKLENQYSSFNQSMDY